MNLYIITGTTKGLGKALADALATDEHNHVITLSRAPDTGNGGRHGRCNYYLDLSRPDSIAGVFERALGATSKMHYEKVVLLNNAGLLEPVGPLSECDATALTTNLTVNLIAPMILMQQFIVRTRKLSACRLVVNISSGAGKRPVAGWSAYCTAKAGLDMASRVAGLEAGTNEPGLIVCSLAPGLVDTPMQTQLRSKSEREFPEVARFRQLKKEGTLRSPEEVAAEIIKLERLGVFENGGVHDIREISAR